MIDRSKLNILIVDDENLHSMLFQQYLKLEGYSQTMIYSPGIFNFPYIEKDKDFLNLKNLDIALVDLIFTRYISEGIGGKEIVKYLKELKKDIFIIGTSGYTKSMIKREMGGYIDEIIEKPIDLSYLKNIIKHHFN